MTQHISNSLLKFVATSFFLVQSGVVAAEEKWINGNLAASELWDSNFFRNPDDISEKITLLTAGVGLSTEISRQRFNAHWRVRSYQHVVNDKFDETLQDGFVRWNGAWGEQYTSVVEWTRDSYLVDRWEAPESDVVAKDDARFVLTRGSESRFSFQIGAHRSKQTHSSLIRDNLNYEENEVFTAVTYQTPAQSTLTLRYKSGDRTYPIQLIENPAIVFDFDYHQFELENIWKVSAKTTTTLTLSKLMKQGVNNNSTGDFALLNLTWDATPKLQWQTGYSYKKPLPGETIDLPSKVQTVFLTLAWEMSSKLSLSNRAEKVHRDYENADEQHIRTEVQYNLIPLSINYLVNDSLSFRLDTGWRKNTSPIFEREYESYLATLGLNFRF